MRIINEQRGEDLGDRAMQLSTDKFSKNLFNRYETEDQCENTAELEIYSVEDKDIVE
jgi:hypothetical protein